jgi:hypothetical protein
MRGIDKQFDAVRGMPVPIPSGERYRVGIEEVAAGGYLRVGGELYRVEQASLYREKDGNWTELELFGLNTAETRYIEWERDDEVEVAWNGPPISMARLGVTPAEVEAMADRERGSISYGGKTYEYDDDYSATFHRGGKGDGEKVYFYDFETSDERFCLSIEEWGSESSGYDYEAYASQYIEPETVEVLVVGDPEPN